MVIAWQTEEDILTQMSSALTEEPTPPPAERTPEQWITKLWRQLEARKARIQLFEDYYQGKQRLRFTTLKMRETFGNEFGAFADNFCLLVVDAVEERLRVTGFRVLSDDGTDQPETPAEEASETPAEETAEDTTVAQQITNDEAWRIWRANGLDSRSAISLEKLGEDEQELRIATGWLRTKLDASAGRPGRRSRAGRPHTMTRSC